MQRTMRQLIWAALLCPVFLNAADDPFVGHWHLREEQHQTTYKIIKVAENKYQTDNGIGLGPVLPVDGSVHETPLGGDVSLKQTGDNTFLYVLKRKTTYKRVITIDGNTMKWDEDQELDTGKHSTYQSVWRRTDHGQGLAGTWEVVSHHDDDATGYDMVIAKTASGISFRSSGQNRVDEMYLDGKEHTSTDPDQVKGLTDQAERLSDRTIRVVSKRYGKIVDTMTMVVSTDGKVMTNSAITVNGKTSTFIWDRVVQ